MVDRVFIVKVFFFMMEFKENKKGGRRQRHEIQGFGSEVPS